MRWLQSPRIHPQHGRAPGGWQMDVCQDVQGGGLARSVGTDQTIHAAFGNLETQIVQHTSAAEPLRKVVSGDDGTPLLSLANSSTDWSSLRQYAMRADCTASTSIPRSLAS